MAASALSHWKPARWYGRSLGRDGRGRLEALGVHGAKSVHVRAERLVLLLVRHDAVEQEGLVAGNAHLAGRKVARGEAKLLRQGGRLRQVRAGKVHKRAVAQPVEAPVAAVARKQAKQLVQRQVVRGDPQVDEVRPHGEPHLHPGRLAAQHPVERVRHVDGARLAKAVHAVQQQPRDGGGVLLAYGRHRAARSRQPEVLLHQLARPGLPRGVARVVRHGVRVAPEHGQAARAVAGLRAARHALARVIQVEVKPQGLRHLVQHLLRRVHVHGLAHAGQDRGRKARHVALAQKHARRVAGIHAREERRHVQQPLGAAKERVLRQRVQVARRREELRLALALQVERAVARLLYAQAHLGVAVRNGHVARRLLHALRHHLDLERAANVQRYELVQLWRGKPQLAANGRLQPRHAKHARRHARGRKRAPVLHGAHQKLRHGARLRVEHVERVHERELLAVLVKRARHDVLRKLAHVAHHVRAARTCDPQAQVPVVLMLDRHLEPHGPGRRVRR
jgi:phosphoglycolate phosphatase-like HAD superfamily hydrolase